MLALVSRVVREWRARPGRAVTIVVSLGGSMAVAVTAFSIMSALVFDDAPGIADLCA